MAGLNELAKRANVKLKDAKNLFSAIQAMLAENNEAYVTIANFGSFRVTTIPGRTVQSPVIQGGEPVTFPAQLSIKFKPAPFSKRKLANMASFKKGRATMANNQMERPTKKKATVAPAKPKEK